MGDDASVCPFCAEPLAPGVERCAACGEHLGPRKPQPDGWGSPGKPTGIVVIAIINLAFGAMGVVGLPIGILSMIFMSSMKLPRSPGMPDFSSPAYLALMVAGFVVGGLGVAALLASGVGLLRMREWARKVAIWYSGFTIIWTIVHAVANYFITIKPMLDAMSAQGGPGSAAATIGGTIGGLFGGCFALILPIATLIVLTRPSVVSAIEAAEAKLAEAPPAT